jgi:hypothetical protein
MGFDDQFLDNENLETNGILNVDLNDLESCECKNLNWFFKDINSQ